MLTIISKQLKVIKQLILAMKTCTTSMIMTENPKNDFSRLFIG